MTNQAESKPNNNIRKHDHKKRYSTSCTMLIRESKLWPIITLLLLFFLNVSANAQTPVAQNSAKEAQILEQTEEQLCLNDIKSIDGCLNYWSPSEGSDKSDYKYFFEIATTSIKPEGDKLELGLSAYFNNSWKLFDLNILDRKSAYVALEGLINYDHYGNNGDLNISSGFYFTPNDRTWIGPHELANGTHWAIIPNLQTNKDNDSDLDIDLFYLRKNKNTSFLASIDYNAQPINTYKVNALSKFQFNRSSKLGPNYHDKFNAGVDVEHWNIVGANNDLFVITPYIAISSAFLADSASFRLQLSHSFLWDDVSESTADSKFIAIFNAIYRIGSPKVSDYKYIRSGYLKDGFCLEKENDPCSGFTTRSHDGWNYFQSKSAHGNNFGNKFSFD